MTTRWVGATVGVVLWACARPVFAQAVEEGFTTVSRPALAAISQDTKHSAAAEPALDEVVVSAQHRLERLQDVPISAQVLSGESQAQANINSLHALSQVVPSVHIGMGGRSDELYIRGVGSGANESFDQSVGLFVDDVYHGRSRTSGATFLDLDRLEVLKGPQSTFFGNNAIAGAFNIVTRKPRETFDAWGRALYGRYGEYAVEGAAGGPLNETFGARIAATASGSDGWLRNLNTGEDQPHQRNVAGRVTLRATPGDSLEALLKIEVGKRIDKSGLFFQIGNCPPPPPFAAAGFCGTALSAGVPTGLDTDRNSESPGQRADLRTFDTALTVNWEHWNHTFTSVSGFYNYKYNLNLDTDAVPPDLLNVQAPDRFHQFSQELRIASPAGERFEYLGGVYFQESELDLGVDFGYFFLTPVVPTIPAFASLVPYLPLGQSTTFGQSERTYSAFGSFVWNVTDQLALSAGLRGSRVKKDFDWRLQYGTASSAYGNIVPLPANLATLPGALGLGTATALSGNRSDDAWMPTARVQYRATPNAMGYLSYTRGFKAGGFNAADNTGVLANLPFAPEHVNAYEAGLKSEWFDDRLLLNVAVFRSDYRDLQVTTSFANSAGTFVSLVRNAAASRSQGVELESQWVATRALRFSLNASYLHSRYVDYRNVTPTAAQTLVLNQCVAANPTNLAGCDSLRTQDLSGRPTQYAPQWSGTAAAAYTIDLPSAGYRVTTHLSASTSTEYYLAPTIDEFLKQPGYARIDARLSLGPADERWSIDVIGNNLTDRDVLVFASNQPRSLGSLILQKAMPRSYALQVSMRW